MELSKKVRDLNSTLETKKTESKQLFGRCRHLENQVSLSSNLKVVYRYGTLNFHIDIYIFQALCYHIEHSVRRFTQNLYINV